MRMIGRKRCLRFRIGSMGNAAYEALLIEPLCRIIKEQTYNSYEEFFITVWFEDMNLEPWDPAKYAPQKSKPKESEEEDAPEISGEQRSSSQP